MLQKDVNSAVKLHDAELQSMNAGMQSTIDDADFWIRKGTIIVGADVYDNIIPISFDRTCPSHITHRNAKYLDNFPEHKAEHDFPLNQL